MTVKPVFATTGSSFAHPSGPPVITLRPLCLPHHIMSHDNPTDSPAPDLNDPQFNSLSPYNHTQFVVANGLVIPLPNTPPSVGTLTPVTYLLSQPALTQTSDIATDAYDVPHRHTHTVIIMHHTCTPMPLVHVLPSSDEMPLFPTASDPPLGSVTPEHSHTTPDHQRYRPHRTNPPQTDTNRCPHTRHRPPQHDQIIRGYGLFNIVFQTFLLAFSQRFLRSYLSFRTYSRCVSRQGDTVPFHYPPPHLKHPHLRNT